MKERHRVRRKPVAAMTKIWFHLPQDDGGGTESMWAEPLGDGRYRVDNIPYAVFGLSFNDIVAASERDGTLTYDRVLTRGGHSTYRVMLTEPIKTSELSVYRRRLTELGCSFEKFSKRFSGIDCPPTSDIHAVYGLIVEAQQKGVWLFDEVHVGHPSIRSN